MSLLGQRPKMILDGVAARACRFGHIHHRDAPAFTRQFEDRDGQLRQVAEENALTLDGSHPVAQLVEASSEFLRANGTPG